MEINRLTWVDAGKGLSIVMVVIYHTTRWMLAAGLPVEPLASINYALADLRMPVFFLLSGLFARKWLTRTWHDVLQYKALLFAWVYVLWSLLGAPIRAVATGFIVRDLDEARAELFRTLAFFPVRSTGAIWFIWALLIFFFVAKATARVPAPMQLGVAAILSAATRLVPDAAMAQLRDLTGLGVRGALLYYVFFIGGCHYSRKVQSAVEQASPLVCSAVVGGWIALKVGLRYLDADSHGLVTFAMSFAGVAAGLALSRLLSHVVVLVWVGRRTLPIYLAHSAAAIFLVLLAQIVPISSTVIAVFMTVAVAALAVVLTLALEGASRVGRFGWLYTPPVRLQALFMRAASPSGPDPRESVRK